MTWSLETLGLDLAAADEIAEQIIGDAPVTAALMRDLIAFNHAVEDRPLGNLFSEVSQLDVPEVAAFIALISDAAQQADEILDSVRLGDFWLAYERKLRKTADGAKASIEQYGEALQQIVDFLNADDED